MPNGNPEELFSANGVDADGKYLQPAVPDHVLANLAQGLPVDPDALATLRARSELKDAKTYGTLGDPNSLAQVGWGVLFADDDKARVPALEEALAPLLDRRKAQAGARYYQLADERAYRGENKNGFLKQFKLGPGTVDPAKLPFYILIVGDPRRIPFRFQQLLDVQFAVGRLHFDGENERDTLERYARYATSVVEAEERAEQGTLRLAKSAVFFGARNDGDDATSLSVDELVVPLTDELRQDAPGWNVSAVVEDEATRAALGALVGGASTSAFFFTASHGLGLKPDDPRLLVRQGALVCSDWAGPGTKVDETHIFSADDVDPGAESARASRIPLRVLRCRHAEAG